MTLDENAVRRVMRARLKTVTGIPSESMLAWENRTFTPPSLSSSAVVKWVMETQTVDGERLSATGTSEALGYTEYTVMVPKGRGTEELDSLAAEIADAFAPGQSLTSDDVRVILERTTRSGIRSPAEHEAWVGKAVSIRWRVFTRNAAPQ